MEGNYIHPLDAEKQLNSTMHTIEALSNTDFLPKQHGWMSKNGKTSEWWYYKTDVEKLMGMDLAALLGFKGEPAFDVEFDKWLKVGLRKEFEQIGYNVWINADIYPDGKIYTKEYTEWLERLLIKKAK